MTARSRDRWTVPRLINHPSCFWLGFGLLLASSLALAVAALRPSAESDGTGVVVGLCLFGNAAGLLLLAWLNRQQQGDLHRLCNAIDPYTKGDLRPRIGTIGTGQVALVAGEVDAMVSSVSSLVARVRSNVSLMAMDSGKLTAESRDLADRTTQQAAELEETSASVEQLVAAVQKSADAANAASKRAGEVESLASNGTASMTEARTLVRSIQQHSSKVSDVVTLIDGLAFQTNILALNAAVEAANARNAGRGFAVVAAEVRRLAQRSAGAAAEIRELIDHSAHAVKDGVQHIETVHAELISILDGVKDLSWHVQQIAAATQEQSSGLTQVGQAISSVDGITQQNARMASLVNSASTKLSERAGLLAASVSETKLRQGSTDEARSMVDKAASTIRQMGLSKAFALFEKPDSGFRDRDLYIFGFDRMGNYLVVGGDPKGRGRKLVDVPGIDVPKLIRDAFETAAAGGGWVEYTALNPVSKVVLEKMSYVLSAGKDAVIGCGIYKDAVA